MSTFNEREKGYESKYAHDQELEFKIRSKRNKLLGNWAAEKMCLPENEIQAYALTVVDKGTQEGYEAVVEKVFSDLREKGIDISLEEIENQGETLFEVAKEKFK